jgi:HEPN domain-containing protein
MSADEAIARRVEAARWLAIAMEDARVAAACLGLDPPHCQQAGEKLLKGLLTAAGAEFALTHDLNRLASAAEPHFPAEQNLFEAVRPLTVWGVAYRYPGVEPAAEPPPIVAEIEQVLGVLRLLSDRLRGLLGA